RSLFARDRRPAPENSARATPRGGRLAPGNSSRTVPRWGRTARLAASFLELGGFHLPRPPWVARAASGWCGPASVVRTANESASDGYRLELAGDSRGLRLSVLCSLLAAPGSRCRAPAQSGAP